jgi:hypothetical protein
MEAQPEREKTNIQRAVKRSQWQEGDGTMIRHMGQATFFRRLSLQASHSLQGLFLPDWITFSLAIELSMSSKQYTPLSARRRSGR